jgi:hypothetical protein
VSETAKLNEKELPQFKMSNRDGLGWGLRIGPIAPRAVCAGGGSRVM